MPSKGFSVLPADDAAWHPSKLTGVLDTEQDALWLVVGAPCEAASILRMGPEQLAELYPDGPTASPPELA